VTVVSLHRPHFRPVGIPPITRLRDGVAAWSALIARSRQTSLDYRRAGTMSARREVLARFAAPRA
jgi:hypothetical protein